MISNEFKIIFRCIAGSHLYGTNTEESDVDERGVFIPSKKYFTGFHYKVDQVEDKQNDKVFYDIRKFFHLCSLSNPNIIELLYVPDIQSNLTTREWEKIILNRKIFLSKKIRYTFMGYAINQLKRIKSHRSWLLNPPKNKPERKDFDLPDYPLISANNIGAFNTILVKTLRKIGKNHSLQKQLEEMEETVNYESIVSNMEFDIPVKEQIKKITDVSDNFLDALNRENKYIQAKNHWESYMNWKSGRNKKRAQLEEKFGFDTKHMMHCFRLVSEARELLEKETITFPRPDSQFLLEIKNGKYSYDHLVELIDDIETIFEDSYNKSSLPEQVNMDNIDSLCRHLVEKNF